MFRLTFVLALVVGNIVLAADPENPSTTDLSMFPTFQGKVVQTMGSFFGYLDPIPGAGFELELSSISECQSLKFKPLPGDAVHEYYIPLPTSSKAGNKVVPLMVESIQTYSNGAIQSMRFISRSDRATTPKPGRGEGPKFVRIWITVEGAVMRGVALVEGKVSDPFPQVPAVKAR